MSRTLPRILVCEESEPLGRGIRDLLRRRDYPVRVVREGVSAWRAIEQGYPDVVITDAHLQGLTGIDLLDRLRKQHATIPVVLMSELDSSDVTARAVNLGAAYFIPKTPKVDLHVEILASLDHVWPPKKSALEQELSRENRELLMKLQEQKRQLDQLATRTAVLERDSHERKSLDLLKCDFITLMSHEMRTPLTSILGFSEVLQQGLVQSPEELTEIIGYVHESGSRLTEFVNDALELFQWYSGMINLEITDVNAGEWIENAVHRVRAKAEAASIAISGGAQGISFEGDAEVLDQTLGRILDNAIKFTEPGGSIRVEAHEVGEEIRLDVIDNGIGIDPAALDSLFTPLEVCGDLNHHSEGKGLSLALVKAAVQTHGGHIAVVSEGVGKGTRVSMGLLQRIPEEMKLEFLVAEKRPPHLLLARLDS